MLNQEDWSEGNGPRDSKTGKYPILPSLEKNKNTPEHKLRRN